MAESIGGRFTQAAAFDALAQRLGTAVEAEAKKNLTARYLSYFLARPG